MDLADKSEWDGMKTDGIDVGSNNGDIIREMHDLCYHQPDHPNSRSPTLPRALQSPWPAR